ncbi:MAG: hypothetical protein GY782_11855 [Gammaproteobacteria bacterium]|nr:hypothetical protein [Gammaproteobacteria bacterium]
MHKKTEKNPFGAGREKNKWESTRRFIPNPILKEVERMIEDWKKEQKK